MANVKFIPLGIEDIVASSGTLAAWGYRKELFQPKGERQVPERIEEIREFLDELKRKYPPKKHSTSN